MDPDAVEPIGFPAPTPPVPVVFGVRAPASPSTHGAASALLPPAAAAGSSREREANAVPRRIEPEVVCGLGQLPVEKSLGPRKTIVKTRAGHSPSGQAAASASVGGNGAAPPQQNVSKKKATAGKKMKQKKGLGSKKTFMLFANRSMLERLKDETVCAEAGIPSVAGIPSNPGAVRNLIAYEKEKEKARVKFLSQWTSKNPGSSKCQKRKVNQFFLTNWCAKDRKVIGTVDDVTKCERHAKLKRQMKMGMKSDTFERDEERAEEQKRADNALWAAAGIPPDAEGIPDLVAHGRKEQAAENLFKIRFRERHPEASELRERTACEAHMKLWAVAHLEFRRREAMVVIENSKTDAAAAPAGVAAPSPVPTAVQEMVLLPCEKSLKHGRQQSPADKLLWARAGLPGADGIRNLPAFRVRMDKACGTYMIQWQERFIGSVDQREQAWPSTVRAFRERWLAEDLEVRRREAEELVANHSAGGVAAAPAAQGEVRSVSLENEVLPSNAAEKDTVVKSESGAAATLPVQSEVHDVAREIEESPSNVGKSDKSMAREAHEIACTQLERSRAGAPNVMYGPATAIPSIDAYADAAAAAHVATSDTASKSTVTPHVAGFVPYDVSIVDDGERQMRTEEHGAEISEPPRPRQTLSLPLSPGSDSVAFTAPPAIRKRPLQNEAARDEICPRTMDTSAGHKRPRCESDNVFPTNSSALSPLTEVATAPVALDAPSAPAVALAVVRPKTQPGAATSSKTEPVVAAPVKMEPSAVVCASDVLEAAAAATAAALTAADATAAAQRAMDTACTMARAVDDDTDADALIAARKQLQLAQRALANAVSLTASKRLRREDNI